MKSFKTAQAQESNGFVNNGPMTKQVDLTNTLQDEALDRPVGGISVQCACFTFSYSAGSPR